MKALDYWDEDAILTDLLFDSNKSIAEIARELDWSQADTTKRIKDLGLSWVRRNNKKLSRGHAALTEIMRRLLPGEEIINEHHVGERLMLDIYCPKYKVAAEYHGRQHFIYNSFHFKSYAEFEAAQARDERKIELCKEQGIVLIAFRFNDKLSDEAVFERLLEAIRSTPAVEKKETTSNFKGNPYYEKMKQRQREHNKAAYQRMKEWKKEQRDTGS